MNPNDHDRRRESARWRNPGKIPKTISYDEIDLDVFTKLLSFYVRTLNLLVSKDLDLPTESLNLSGGTGKISTILLIDANPGLRPSVLAHFIRKDRSALTKLLTQMEAAGYLEQHVSPTERRARELYLTDKGRELARRTRKVVKAQDDDFFAMLSAEEKETLVDILGKVYTAYIDLHPAGGS